MAPQGLVSVCCALLLGLAAGHAQTAPSPSPVPPPAQPSAPAAGEPKAAPPVAVKGNRYDLGPGEVIVPGSAGKTIVIRPGGADAVLSCLCRGGKGACLTAGGGSVVLCAKGTGGDACTGTCTLVSVAAEGIKKRP